MIQPYRYEILISFLSMIGINVFKFGFRIALFIFRNGFVIMCSSCILFCFAKNKRNFDLIHDLIIPSLVTGRILSGFEWFSIGFDSIKLMKLMVFFQLNSFCIYSKQEVFHAQFRI
jgi:hypothetical protein